MGERSDIAAIIGALAVHVDACQWSELLALFAPDVVRLDLWHPPATHRQGPTFLNVLRVLDMPQALALALPRQVKLYVKDDAEAKAWDWAMQLQQALGEKGIQVRRVAE